MINGKNGAFFSLPSSLFFLAHNGGWHEPIFRREPDLYPPPPISSSSMSTCPTLVYINLSSCPTINESRDSWGDSKPNW